MNFKSRNAAAIVLLFTLVAPLKPVEGARVKEFVTEKFATCVTPSSDSYLIKFPGQINYTTGSNTVDFYGSFNVTETIQEPLELLVITNRCSMDMTTCEPLSKIPVPNICGSINDANGLFASFFNSMTPKFHCPVRPGEYRFGNSTLNLKFFTTFPLEGYRWQASLKLYSKNKARRELFCIFGQVSMRWVRKA